MKRLEIHKKVCEKCRDTEEVDQIAMETDRSYPGESQRFLSDASSREVILRLLENGITSISIMRNTNTRPSE